MSVDLICICNYALQGIFDALFFALVLPPRKNKYLTATLIAAAWTCCGVVGYAYLYTSPWRTLLGFIFCFGLIVALYRATFLKKLLWYCLNLVLTMLCELITLTAAQFLFGFNPTQICDVRCRGITMVIFNALLLLQYLAIFAFLKHNDFSLSAKEMLCITAVLILEFVIIAVSVNTIYTLSAESSTLLTVFSLIELLFCFFLLYTLRQTSQRNMLKLKNSCLQSQINMQYQYYAVMKQHTQDTGKYRHDIYNHLKTMQALLESGNLCAAQTYFADLQQKFDGMDTHFCREDQVLDAIMTYKYPVIRQYEIDLQATFNLNEKLTLPAADLVSVFSNLLDNAIEAARNAAEKTILLECYTKAGMLVIKIQNTYADGASPRVNDDPFCPHGLGMDIIKEICENYGGEFRTQKEHGHFLSIACLNLCS